MNKTQEKEMKTANQKRNTQKKKIFKKIITGKDKQEKNKKIKSRRTKMIEEENRRRCVRTCSIIFIIINCISFIIELC